MHKSFCWFWRAAAHVTETKTVIAKLSERDFHLYRFSYATKQLLHVQTAKVPLKLPQSLFVQAQVAQ